LQLVNRATHRADAKPGSAEIQVVGALGPVRGAYAKDVVGMNRFNVAHRVVAAPPGLQAGKTVVAPGGLFAYCCRNVEHYLVSPDRSFRILVSLWAGVLINVRLASL
jgi:hypothetical protein